MASKRRQKRKVCGNKKAFDEEAPAVREAIRLRNQHPGEIIDAYKCTNCGRFHVGHRPKLVRQIINRRKANE